MTSTRHTVGLPVAVAVLMTGVVFAANGGRYGAMGVVLGLLAAVAGGVAAFWLFRSGRGSSNGHSGSDDT